MFFDVKENDLLQYKKLTLIGNLAPLKEHIKLFEAKYGLEYEKFEEMILDETEDFEKWDDYIEWKAYKKKYDELSETLTTIDNA